MPRFQRPTQSGAAAAQRVAQRQQLLDDITNADGAALAAQKKLQVQKQQRELEARVLREQEAKAEHRRLKRKRKKDEKKELKQQSKNKRRALADVTNDQSNDDDDTDPPPLNQLALDHLAVEPDVPRAWDSPVEPDSAVERPLIDVDVTDGNDASETNDDDDDGHTPRMQKDPSMELELEPQLERPPPPTEVNDTTTSNTRGAGQGLLGEAKLLGFIDLDDADARALVRKTIAPRAMVYVDGRFAVYWTNATRVWYGGERSCLRDVWVAATGMTLTELGLLKGAATAARKRLGYEDDAGGLSVGVVLNALQAVRSPFQLRKQPRLIGRWSSVFSQTTGVFFMHVRLDDGDGHAVYYDADRSGCFSAAAKDGTSGKVHTLEIEDVDRDPANEAATKAKLRAMYGLVAPKFVYLLVVDASRVAETLYARDRVPGEKLGAKLLAARK